MHVTAGGRSGLPVVRTRLLGPQVPSDYDCAALNTARSQW